MPLTAHGSYAIAIGASDGGISALGAVLRHLPPQLNATVFIVQHLSPEYESVLSSILQRASAWPCNQAVDGELFNPGHVYVSPPDRHLQVDTTRMHLSRADKVRYVRPSIDVLFQSVASAFRRRAIGIVLTGRLHDGTDGLRAIARAGGATVVQDPQEAYAPGMPQSALNALRVDRCLLLDQIGPYLQQSIAPMTSRVAT